MTNNEDYLDSLLNSMMDEEQQESVLPELNNDTLNENGSLMGTHSSLDILEGQEDLNADEAFLLAYEEELRRGTSQENDFFGDNDMNFDSILGNLFGQENTAADDLFGSLSEEDIFGKNSDGKSPKNIKQKVENESAYPGQSDEKDSNSDEKPVETSHQEEEPKAPKREEAEGEAAVSEESREAEEETASEEPRKKVSLEELASETFGESIQDQTPGEEITEDNVMDKLSEMGDEDLSDIDAMLKAEENGELIEGDEAEPTAADLVAVDLDQLDGAEISEIKELSEISQEKEGQAETEEKSEGKKGKNKKSKKEKKEGGGLLQKIMAFLMSDGDEDEIELQDPNAVEKLGDETAQVLDEMSKEEKAAAKKAAKEAKKKEKEEAKKKKEEAAKAKKEAKPKKEKKPKKVKPPKEQEAPGKKLPKLPVFLILLLFASITVFILLGSRLVQYQMSIRDAHAYYDKGEYKEAYEKLAGLELEEEDKELFYRARICAGLDNYVNSYDNFVTLNMEADAVNQLILFCKNFEEFKPYIEEYGLSTVISPMYDRVTEILRSSYNLSYEDAIALTYLSRKNYSIAIYRLIG